MRISDKGSDEEEMDLSRSPPKEEGEEHPDTGFQQRWEFRRVWSVDLNSIITEFKASYDDVYYTAIAAAIPIASEVPEGDTIVIKPLSVDIRQDEDVDLRVEIIGVMYKPGLSDGNLGKRWRLICENQLAQYLLPVMCSSICSDVHNELIVVVNGLVNESSHQIWLDKNDRRTTVIVLANHPPFAAETRLYRKGSCDNRITWIHNLENRKILVVTPLPPLGPPETPSLPSQVNGTANHRCDLTNGKESADPVTSSCRKGRTDILNTPLQIRDEVSSSDTEFEDSENENESRPGAVNGQDMQPSKHRPGPLSRTRVRDLPSPTRSSGSRSSCEGTEVDAEESSEGIIGPSDNEADQSSEIQSLEKKRQNTSQLIGGQERAHDRTNATCRFTPNDSRAASAGTTTPLKKSRQNTSRASREALTPGRDSTFGAYRTVRDGFKKIVSPANKQAGLHRQTLKSISPPTLDLSDSSSDGDFGNTVKKSNSQTLRKSSEKYDSNTRHTHSKAISSNADDSKERSSSRRPSQTSPKKAVRRNISAELEEKSSDTSSDAYFGITVTRGHSAKKAMRIPSDSSDAEAEAHSVVPKTRKKLQIISDDSSDEGIDKCQASLKATKTNTRTGAKRNLFDSSEETDEVTNIVPPAAIPSPSKTRQLCDSDEDKTSDTSSDTVVIAVSRRSGTSSKPNSQTVTADDKQASSIAVVRQSNKIASPKVTEVPRSQRITTGSAIKGSIMSSSSGSSKGSVQHSSSKEKPVRDTAESKSCKKRLKFSGTTPLKRRKSFGTYEFDSDEDEDGAVSAKAKNPFIDESSDEDSIGANSAKENMNNEDVEGEVVVPKDRLKLRASRASAVASAKSTTHTLTIAKSPVRRSPRDSAATIIRRARNQSSSASESESEKHSAAPKRRRRGMSNSRDSDESVEGRTHKNDLHVPNRPNRSKVVLESDESTGEKSTSGKKMWIDTKRRSEAEQELISPSRSRPSRPNLTPQTTPKRFPVEVYTLRNSQGIVKSVEQIPPEDQVNSSRVSKTKTNVSRTPNNQRGSKAGMGDVNDKSYEKLKDLEEELGSSRSHQALTKRNVYGIVEDVLKMAIQDTQGYCKTTKEGTYELRISDETKTSVFTRICTMPFNPLKLTKQMMAGPVIKKGDIIRIHRATVQYEKLDGEQQLVVSTSPHLNYTLFDNNVDDFEAPLEPCRRLHESANPVSSIDVSIVTALRRYSYKHTSRTPRRASSRNTNSSQTPINASKSPLIAEFTAPESPEATPRKEKRAAQKLTPKKPNASQSTPDEPIESQATVIDENITDYILSSDSEEMEVNGSQESCAEELPVLSLNSAIPIPCSGRYDIEGSSSVQGLRITRLEDVIPEDETITYNFFVKIVDLEMLPQKAIMLLRVRDGTMPRMDFQTMLLSESLAKDTLDIEIQNISSNKRRYRTLIRHLHQVVVLQSVRRITELRGGVVKLIASIEDVLIL